MGLRLLICVCNLEGGVCVCAELQLLETKHLLFGLECFMFNGINEHRIWAYEDKINLIIIHV